MSRLMRVRRGLVIAVALVGSLVAMVPGATAEGGKAPRQMVSASVSGELPVSDPAMDGAVRAPRSTQAQERVTSSACTPSPDGQTRACLQSLGADKEAEVLDPSRETSATAIQPFPDVCIQNPYTGIWATRIQACEVQRLFYQTERFTNGTWVTTGQALMNVLPLAYTSTSLPTWAHQIQVSAYQGWGDALNATVQGDATPTGNCTRRNSSFPPQGLRPLGSFKDGESTFDTTVSISGTKGTCVTTWNLSFVNGAYTPAGISYDMLEIRCDNATAGTTNVGCVIPWYPAAAIYSRSSYPSLASHVERAQASGLPGATFEAPLTRTTNKSVEDANRNLACGDAPSIAGLSCDEYPPAASYQGLSAGGTRRTFGGCNFNLPSGTGPTGVSVCMITATENNAQGGIHTQLFRTWRVLDGDPFRILVG